MTTEPEPPPKLCGWDSMCLYRAKVRLVKGHEVMAVCDVHLRPAERQGWERNNPPL